MKTKLRRFLAAGLLTLAAPVLPAQQSMVPEAMNYQGVITDAQGNLIAPGAPENRNVEFRIYDAATGGNLLWGETQTVTIFRGNFSVILGNGTALGGDTPSQAAGLAAVFANTISPDLFFGITPQGGAEFAPRQKLVSSAFALRARVAENVMSTSGNNSLRNLTVSGDLRLDTGALYVNTERQIRFGDGISGRSSGSGLFYATPTAMNISGMSNNGNDSARRIIMRAEAGTEFTGPISFGSRAAQHINLFSTTYGLGIQSSPQTLYQRTATNFAWYRGGVHAASGAGTGGTLLANLSNTGFDLKVGRFIGDGSGLTNLTGDGSGLTNLTINPNSLPNNYNYLGINGTGVIEFGRGVTKEAAAGRIGYRTYSPDALDIVGAGSTSSNRKIKLFAEGGTEMTGGLQVSGNLQVNGQFTNRVRITSNTGTLAAPLEVTGVSTLKNFSGVSRFYRFSSSRYGIDNDPASATVSIRGTGAVEASQFFAMSDIRMKLPEGRSDAARDLEILSALEVTDYTMKDRSVSGDRPFKKLIAQQVEAVFPQAVSRSFGTLPDIFRLANARDGFIAFQESGEVDLKVGETVRLVYDDADFVAEVTGVTEEGFTVKDAVKDAVKDGELFVYGRQVDDRRAVDYEAIAMLNVSATQELARQLKQQSEQLAAVQAERDALAKEIRDLRATTSRQDSRLSAIEAQIEAMADPVVELVSLPTNVGGN